MRGGFAPCKGGCQSAHRAVLLNHAIYLSVLSALCIAALLIVAFVCALVGVGHRTGVALMFALALALLMAALVESRTPCLRPRWTAYDQKRFGIKMPDYVPMATQRRAYTSPIWYKP